MNYYDEIKHNISINAFQDISKVIVQAQEEASNSEIQFVKLKDNTIQALVNVGVPNLPMMEKVGHVRENILTRNQAQKLGFSIKNKHYHGLGVKTFLEIIDSMDNPIAVYQYTDKGKYDSNNFIIVTSVKINGKKSIVPIEINQRGQYNSVEIDFNKIKSLYAKDDDNYIKDLLTNNKIKEVFTGSNSQQTSPVVVNDTIK